jgi:hypothetical protein
MTLCHERLPWPAHTASGIVTEGIGLGDLRPGEDREALVIGKHFTGDSGGGAHRRPRSARHGLDAARAGGAARTVTVPSLPTGGQHRRVAPHRSGRRVAMALALTGSAALVLVTSLAVARLTSNAEAARVAPTAARDASPGDTLLGGDRFAVRFASHGGCPLAGDALGVWAPPIKLLDQLTFSAAGAPLGPATAITREGGAVHMRYPTRQGLGVSRVDLVPDGIRAALVALTFTATSPRRLELGVQARSALAGGSPFTGTPAGRAATDVPDDGYFEDDTLVFQDVGTAPTTGHDWAVVIGSQLRPQASYLASRTRTTTAGAAVRTSAGCAQRTDGPGLAGRLSYHIAVDPGRPTTVWFAVAGSDRGVADARAEQRRALAHPADLLAHTAPPVPTEVVTG